MDPDFINWCRVHGKRGCRVILRPTTLPITPDELNRYSQKNVSAIEGQTSSSSMVWPADFHPSKRDFKDVVKSDPVLKQFIINELPMCRVNV